MSYVQTLGQYVGPKHRSVGPYELCLDCNENTDHRSIISEGFVPKRWEGRVCKYMHERTIHSVRPQGRTVQKGGSNPPKPFPANHTLPIIHYFQVGSALQPSVIFIGNCERMFRKKLAKGDTVRIVLTTFFIFASCKV